MDLTEFIDKTKVELGIKYPTKDIEDYIRAGARKIAKNNCAVINDEEIREWILQYTPEDSDKAKEEKEDKTILSPETIAESVAKTGMEPLL